MKLLIGSMLVAGLIAAGPALAYGGGHGHWKHGHGHGHWKHGHGYHRQHVVVREYWRPAPVYHPAPVYYPVPVYPRPVYYRPAPPPGVHIVLPNVYIPWR